MGTKAFHRGVRSWVEWHLKVLSIPVLHDWISRARASALAKTASTKEMEVLWVGVKIFALQHTCHERVDHHSRMQRGMQNEGKSFSSIFSCLRNSIVSGKQQQLTGNPWRGSCFSFIIVIFPKGGSAFKWSEHQIFTSIGKYKPQMGLQHEVKY